MPTILCSSKTVQNFLKNCPQAMLACLRLFPCLVKPHLSDTITQTGYYHTYVVIQSRQVLDRCALLRTLQYHIFPQQSFIFKIVFSPKISKYLKIAQNRSITSVCRTFESNASSLKLRIFPLNLDCC